MIPRPRLLLAAVCCTLLGLLTLAPVVSPIVSLRAQEAVTLTTPIVKPSTTVCSLDALLLDVVGKRIVAQLACPNGDPITKQYDSFTTPTGATLLSTLNRSNFTTNSLIKAVYTRLIADGVISGTVTGTAQ